MMVALGTNSLLSPEADASYRKMASLVKASSSRCTWIGPPHLNPSQSKGFPAGRIAQEERNLNGFYDSLASAVDSHCDLIESREATASGTPGYETVDGVHRTEGAGKYWANALMDQLHRQVTFGKPPATAH